MNIEAVINDLAYSGKVPKNSISDILATPTNDMLERTIDIIERCIACGDLADGVVGEDEAMALVILILVFGEMGEQRLFGPLLRLLSTERDKLDQLPGDHLTESIQLVLISTFNGEENLLVDLMNNEHADSFCRDAAFRVWTYLAAGEIWPMSASKAYLADGFEKLQPGKDDYIWVS